MEYYGFDADEIALRRMVTYEVDQAHLKTCDTPVPQCPQCSEAFGLKRGS